MGSEQTDGNRDIVSCREKSRKKRRPVTRLQPASDRAVFQAPDDMLQSMNALGLKNTKSRRTKMRNLRVAHIAATLYGPIRSERASPPVPGTPKRWTRFAVRSSPRAAALVEWTPEPTRSRP